MRRKLINTLTISSIITTIGYIMDEDPVEPSMLMRFIEFFCMIGIVSLLISLVYFSFTFIFKTKREHK